MFTLKDIEMLPVPPNTKMIIVRDHVDDPLDKESKQIISKQVKKALKLPVIFVSDGIEVTAYGDD